MTQKNVVALGLLFFFQVFFAMGIEEGLKRKRSNSEETQTEREFFLKTISSFQIATQLLEKEISPITLARYNSTDLVTLDALSKQKNGGIIKKADLVVDPQKNIADLFRSLPATIKNALKNLYHIDDDVFNE